MLVPPSHPQHDAHDGEHDRHLDQDADHGCERGTRLKAKDAIAAATASSKKFEAPISADGQAAEPRALG